MIQSKNCLFFLLMVGASMHLQPMDNNERWLIHNTAFFQDEEEQDGQVIINAVRHGLNAVREYLDNGGNARTGEGVGMYEAARQGDYEIIELLFSRGDNMHDFTTGALEIALQYEHQELIPLLALLGADIGSVLWQAQNDGRHDIVTQLEMYNLEAI